MDGRKVTGWSAIKVAELSGLELSKYNDPTEPARHDLTVEDATEIARVDPSLIYQFVEFLGWHGPGGEPLDDADGLLEEYYWDGDTFLGPDDDGIFPAYGYGEMPQ